MLFCVSEERVREEIEKMMAADSLAAIELLASLPSETKSAIFRGRIRLTATMRPQ